MQRFSSIVITGASSGIGAELALQYAAPGVTLALFGRSAERLAGIAERCAEYGAKVHSYVADVRDADDMRDRLTEFDALAPIDLIIANAGISAGLGEESESEAQVRQVFSVNVDGVFNSVLPVLPWMQRRKRGHVAIMSSLAGLRGIPSCPAYSASKNAVRAFGEGLRGAYHKYGVTVSVICPGYIRTPMTEVNSFPMPFIMSVGKAARIIRHGLAKGKSRIAFPLALYLPIWLLTCLPVALTDPFFRALPKKSSLPTDGKSR